MKYLLYVTKSKPTINKYEFRNDVFYRDASLVDADTTIAASKETLNGYVVAEFDGTAEEYDATARCKNFTSRGIGDEEIKKGCVSEDALSEYQGKKEKIYGIHISNLKVFPMRKELNELRPYCEEWKRKKYGAPCKCKYSKMDVYFDHWCMKRVQKAPQNMCRVIYKNEIYILISVQPQWAVKILNGEKTIEWRKVIIKEEKECH